jgi:hypothetical protein
MKQIAPTNFYLLFFLNFAGLTSQEKGLNNGMSRNSTSFQSSVQHYLRKAVTPSTPGIQCHALLTTINSPLINPSRKKSGFLLLKKATFKIKRGGSNMNTGLAAGTSHSPAARC